MEGLNPSLIFEAIAVAACLVAAAVVMSSSCPKKVSRSFALMMFSPIFYELCLLLEDLVTPGAESAYFWQRLGLVGVILTPPLLFQFVCSVSERDEPTLPFRSVIRVLYVAAIFLILLLPTRLLLAGVEKRGLEYWGKAGSLYPLLALFFFAGFVLALVEMSIKFAQTKSLALRRQIAYFWVSMAIVAVGALFEFLPGLTEVYSVGNLTVDVFADLSLVAMALSLAVMALLTAYGTIGWSAAWLSAERDLMKSLVSAVPQGLAVISPDNKLVGGNQKFFEMLGYKPRELVGKDCHLWCPVGTPLIDEEQMSRRLEGKNAIYAARLNRKDGGFLLAGISESPRLSSEGEYLGVAVAITDVSERDSEKKLREVGESASKKL